MILKELKISTNLSEPTNCYIIHDEETKETMVIDAAGDINKIIEMLDILKAKLKYIYLTHCHGDHIGAVNELKNKYGAKILIHRQDAEGLNNADVNLTQYIGMGHIELDADSRVDDGDLIHLGKIELKVIHTPGHTKGGSSLFCEKEKIVYPGHGKSTRIKDEKPIYLELKPKLY